MRNFQLLSCTPEDDVFNSLPLTLYSPGTSIASEVNKEYLKECLVVLEAEKPVARLAIYLNEFIRIDNQQTALIGNYECIDDDVVAAFILVEAFRLILNWGIHRVLGPISGSTWDHYRFKSSENPPFLSEAQNKPWYIRQFESAEFIRCAQYFSALDRHMESDRPSWTQREQELKQMGMSIRGIRLQQLEDELSSIYHFNLIAFTKNEFYTPISEGRFLEKYLPLKALIQPDLVRIAESSSGEMIGYIFCFMNLLNKDEKQLIIKTIARHPDKQWRGLGQTMASEVIRYAKSIGCSSIIHAYMFDDGTSAPVSADNNGENWA
ncbi:MAG: GNAT family N-acetyltransferase, partial [Flavobacteriales bacterium]